MRVSNELLDFYVMTFCYGFLVVVLVLVHYSEALGGIIYITRPGTMIQIETAVSRKTSIEAKKTKIKTYI